MSSAKRYNNEINIKLYIKTTGIFVSVVFGLKGCFKGFLFNLRIGLGVE